MEGMDMIEVLQDGTWVPASDIDGDLEEKIDIAIIESESEDDSGTIEHAGEVWQWRETVTDDERSNGPRRR